MKIIAGSTSKGGHYSHAIASHGMLYISGQLPIDHATGKLAAGGAAEVLARLRIQFDKEDAALGQPFDWTTSLAKVTPLALA